jgi:hypothetical protein
VGYIAEYDEPGAGETVDAAVVGAVEAFENVVAEADEAEIGVAETDAAEADANLVSESV